MSRIIQTGITKEILSGDNHPQIQVGDKLYIVDDRKSTYVSDIDFQLDGSVCYYIARPAYNSAGQLIGVFAGAVKLDEIDAMVSELSMGKDGKAILVGSNGVLISHIRGVSKYMDLSYSDKAGYKGLDLIAVPLIPLASLEVYAFLETCIVSVDAPPADDLPAN